jgi:hypothetical protein
MTLVGLNLIVVVTAETSAWASVHKPLGGEPYSTKVGQIPKSQRVQHTFKATSDVTVFPAPASSNPSVSQLAAVDAAGGPTEIGVAGESVHPTALFGLISDSVIVQCVDWE